LLVLLSLIIEATLYVLRLLACTAGIGRDEVCSLLLAGPLLPDFPVFEAQYGKIVQIGLAHLSAVLRGKLVQATAAEELMLLGPVQVTIRSC